MLDFSRNRGIIILVVKTLGYRQAVRLQILNLPSGGSNPSTPANEKRIHRKMGPFFIRRDSNGFDRSGSEWVCIGTPRAATGFFRRKSESIYPSQIREIIRKNGLFSFCKTQKKKLLRRAASFVTFLISADFLGFPPPCAHSLFCSGAGDRRNRTPAGNNPDCSGRAVRGQNRSHRRSDRWCG